MAMAGFDWGQIVVFYAVMHIQIHVYTQTVLCIHMQHTYSYCFPGPSTYPGRWIGNSTNDWLNRNVTSRLRPYQLLVQLPTQGISPSLTVWWPWFSAKPKASTQSITGTAMYGQTKGGIAISRMSVLDPGRRQDGTPFKTRVNLANLDMPGSPVRPGRLRIPLEWKQKFQPMRHSISDLKVSAEAPFLTGWAHKPTGAEVVTRRVA